MHLPTDFQKKMKQLLGEECNDFLKTYNGEPAKGLRVNTLKISVDDFLNQFPYKLTNIPWIDEGFYYDEDVRPGKHVYHEAGLYYIQEPSAMAVGKLLNPKPGEKVLDLCAAPGGKTTYIGMKMEQEGLLVANEIHPGRAKILSQNVERMGIKNAVVTNEPPDRLAKKFPAFFDRVVVDAPCSGEGMFRKDEEAMEEWSIENVQMCSIRQLDILEAAQRMVRPGGRLVYSTCTFSPEENEGVINKFLNEYPSFVIESVEKHDLFDQGRPEWTDGGKEELKETIRLWPHKLRGEGHFIAVLRKTDGEEHGSIRKEEGLKNRKQLKDYNRFVEETLTFSPSGTFTLFGEQLYILPDEMIPLKNLKVIRPGWHLGTMKKNRFEPSHALALSLTTDDVKQSYDLKIEEAIRYLRGESFRCHGEKGWYLMTVDGFSIGWGKSDGQTMKNHYPKGLRLRS